MITLSDPLVSICMITYNHEKYISQAIEGVLLQEFNYKMELVIGEDCSLDSTRAICEKYANEHPEIIKLLPSEQNLGVQRNFLRTLQACRGKYIALCEGDDYWTDPLKLKIQVQFLDDNISLSACFHDCAISNEITGMIQKNASKANFYRRSIFDTRDLILDWFLNTCTVMFRKQSLFIPSELSGFLIDRLLLQLISLNGPIAYLKNEMAVYRKHIGGITRLKYKSEDIRNIELRWDLFNQYTKFRFNKSVNLAKRLLIYEFHLSQLQQTWLTEAWYKIKNLDLLYYKNQRDWLKTIHHLLGIIKFSLVNISTGLHSK